MIIRSLLNCVFVSFRSVAKLMAARLAAKQLVADCGRWVKKEAVSLWKGFSMEHVDKKDTEVLYDFTNPKSIKNFVCLTDTEIGGKSDANLTTSKHGRLHFHGNVSIDVDDDLEIDHSGFCAIRSKPIKGLFNKIETTDLSYYDCIEIKYRGDGRPYFVNIQTESMLMFENKFDLFQGFLFTKGGPYWEIDRIPFTKFLVTYQGWLQDNQHEFDNVRTIGISLCDKKGGPFSLEIESLKMVRIGYQPPTFKSYHNPRYQLTG